MINSGLSWAPKVLTAFVFAFGTFSVNAYCDSGVPGTEFDTGFRPPVESSPPSPPVKPIDYSSDYLNRELRVPGASSPAAGVVGNTGSPQRATTPSQRSTGSAPTKTSTTQGSADQRARVEALCRSTAGEEKGAQDCVNQIINGCKQNHPDSVDQCIQTNASILEAELRGSSTTGATSAVAAAVEQCKQATSEAVKFCNDPLGEATGMGTGSKELLGGAAQMGAAYGMMGAASGDPKSIQSACENMKTMGNGVAGANAGIAAACYSHISDCENSCEQAVTMATADPTAAQFKTTAKAYLGRCQSMTQKVSEMAGAAGQSYMAGKWGELCADMTKNNQKIVPKEDGTFNLPQDFCMQNPSSPSCSASGYAPPNTGSNGVWGASGSDTSGKFSDAELAALGDGDPSQLGVSGGAEITDAMNPGVPGGGGGGAPGGEGAPGGGDERQKGARSASFSADVLGGERGGGGYTGGAGGAAGAGGWAGYGGAGNGRGKEDPFDLRKFLPGQANAPIRGPAGLGRVSAEIGRVHEDIFKKISDRVQFVCRTNRLKDCR